MISTSTVTSFKLGPNSNGMPMISKPKYFGMVDTSESEESSSVFFLFLVLVFLLVFLLVLLPRLFVFVFLALGSAAFCSP